MLDKIDAELAAEDLNDDTKTCQACDSILREDKEAGVWLCPECDDIPF